MRQLLSDGSVDAQNAAVTAAAKPAAETAPLPEAVVEDHRDSRSRPTHGVTLKVKHQFQRRCSPQNLSTVAASLEATTHLGNIRDYGEHLTGLTSAMNYYASATKAMQEHLKKSHMGLNWSLVPTSSKSIPMRETFWRQAGCNQANLRFTIPCRIDPQYSHDSSRHSDAEETGRPHHEMRFQELGHMAS